MVAQFVVLALTAAPVLPPPARSTLAEAPEWRRREHRLKVATIAAGAGTAAAILGIFAAVGVMAWAREHGDHDRGVAAGWAMLGLGEVAGLGFATTIGFGATLQSHRGRATELAPPLRPITPMERAEGVYDARRDPAWITRDHALTGWMFGTGVLAGVSAIPAAIFLAADLGGPGECDSCDLESRLPWITTGMLTAAGVVGLAVVGGLRHRHRAPIRRWQLRLGAGGLTLRF